jgi:hypothetical protein
MSDLLTDFLPRLDLRLVNSAFLSHGGTASSVKGPMKIATRRSTTRSTSER